MFLINTTPLRIHSQMSEYTRFLLLRYAGWYLNAGVHEVIVFDDLGRCELHPKAIERTRRDSILDTDHDHLAFSDRMKVSAKWRDTLSCKKCKRHLVVYIGESRHYMLLGQVKGKTKTKLGTPPVPVWSTLLQHCRRSGHQSVVTHRTGLW